MRTSSVWAVGLACSLFSGACASAEQPNCPYKGLAAGEREPGRTAVTPAVPNLPPLPESVLADQIALATLPVGFVRTEDGRIYCEKDGAEMVLVPWEGFTEFSKTLDPVIEGVFVMGDDSSTEADEKPAHCVSLSRCLLDRHEVTNAQFAKFVAETGYRTDAEEQGVAHALVGDSFIDIKGADWRHPGGPGTSVDGLDSHPVVLVSWNDARAYGEWAGRRLPTEAEFERVLRGGVHAAKYPWGDGEVPPPASVNLSDEAAKRAHGKWVGIPGYEDGFAGTAPVGTFPQNAFGLFDVSGNVWEWCSDWYSPDYYGRTPALDPTGDYSGVRRVYRGGGWDCDLFGARCSCRNSGKPGLRLPYLGFRAAMDLR